MLILLPTSLGEAFDRLSILRVKLSRVKDNRKIELVRDEFSKIANSIQATIGVPLYNSIMDKYYQILIDVNFQLWGVLEEQRQAEERRADAKYKDLAHRVTKLNDERYCIKKQINEEYDSDIKEVKEYSTVEL